MLLTVEEQFCHLVTNLPPACLVCIQLLLDVANGEPIYGEPVVTVIASPMASLQGQLSQISDIWPSQSALQPIGYNLNTLDEDSDITLTAAFPPPNLLLTHSLPQKLPPHLIPTWRRQSTHLQALNCVNLVL
jgi:hypothetical protein